MLSAKQIVAELLESLNREIKDAGQAEDFCSLTVQPGAAVVYDLGPESGCGGNVWVRVAGANPTMIFPNADTQDGNCAYSLAYTVEMGMIRPAPAMEDRLGAFILPEDAELFDAAMLQLDDLDLMYRAIRRAGVPQLVVGDYSPIGPEGGVYGGMWTLQAGGDGDD